MRNQIGHRSWHTVDFDEEAGTPVFPQQLTAPPARSDRCVVAEGAHRDETTAARAHELADHPALGAQGETIRRILDVAARHDPSIVDESCRTDAEFRVRDVGELHCLASCFTECVPIDRRHGTQR